MVLKMRAPSRSAADYACHVLEDGDILPLVLEDLWVFPPQWRVMVIDAEAELARALLTLAGLGDWLQPE